MTSKAGHFQFIVNHKRNYFFVGVVSAFLSDEQQAFLSDEVQAFLSFSLHVAVAAFLVSSFVEALTVEAAKPIVNATAKTIANFFMISNFYWL